MSFAAVAAGTASAAAAAARAAGVPSVLPVPAQGAHNAANGGEQDAQHQKRAAIRGEPGRHHATFTFRVSLVDSLEGRSSSHTKPAIAAAARTAPRMEPLPAKKLPSWYTTKEAT